MELTIYPTAVPGAGFCPPHFYILHYKNALHKASP